MNGSFGWKNRFIDFDPGNSSQHKLIILMKNELVETNNIHNTITIYSTRDLLDKWEDSKINNNCKKTVYNLVKKMKYNIQNNLILI